MSSRNQISKLQMRKQVITEKQKNYDLKFKMSAIKCAEKTTNRQAARKFAVDVSMIRQQYLQQINSKRKRLAGAERKPVLGDLEELLEKIIDEREKHYHVACKILTVWAQELAMELAVDGCSIL